jgi:exosortase
MSSAPVELLSHVSPVRDPRNLTRYAPVIWGGIFLIAAYWPVLARMAYQWQNDEDMAHGMFAPLFAFYAAWERREELFEESSGGGHGWGLVLIFSGGLLLAFGTLGAEIFFQRIAILLSLTGLILYGGGWERLRILGFPLLMLLFMIPLPGLLQKTITFPLQLLSTRLSEIALDILGYSVVREGNILELAGQQLSVVEACSGLKSILSLAFFTLAYGYLMNASGSMRLFLLASSIPIAVLANSLRIVLTGMVGEYDQKLAAGIFHSFSGWTVFVLAIVLIMGVHRLGSLVAYRRNT